MQKMPPTLFFLPPMECKEVKSVRNLPHGDHWQYEIKLDGYRCIAIKQKNEVELFSSRGLPFSQFLNNNQALQKQPPKSFILDGEIVALDQHGRSDFNALQNAGGTKRSVHFYAFDLLHLNGDNLQDLPLSERQSRLQSAFNADEFFHINPPLDADLDLILSKMEQFGFEGVVAKDKNSLYHSGKIPETWVKLKIKQ